MSTRPGPTTNSEPRRRRATRIGQVTSDVRDKTVSVAISYSAQHGKYGKTLRRRTVFQVHDEKNEAHVGDTVEIMECRPISKSKHWRLLRIIKQAPRQAVRAAAGGAS